MLQFYLTHVKKPILISFVDKSMGYETGLSSWLICRPCNDICVCTDFLGKGRTFLYYLKRGVLLLLVSIER